MRITNSPTRPLKAERMSAAVILLTGNLATYATCRAFSDSSVTGPKKNILTEVEGAAGPQVLVTPSIVGFCRRKDYCKLRSRFATHRRLMV